MDSGPTVSPRPADRHLRPRHARTLLRTAALGLLLLGAAACGGEPEDVAQEQADARRVTDDATAEALRAIANATNEALAGAESVPAPINALARSAAQDAAIGGDGEAEIEEGAPAGASGDTSPYTPTGAESEPAAVVAAEEGRIGRPALVWFHAEWCQVCQEIAPDMAAIRESFGADIAFVKVDIDDPEADLVERRFNVRGTPTFVLFDADGRTAGHMPGWPGAERMTAYLDQLDAQ